MKSSILLVSGLWLIFGMAYLTQPISPGVNDAHLSPYRSAYDAIGTAAPEMTLPPSVVDGVAIYTKDPPQPVDLSPIDISVAELRIAAQEVKPDEFDIQPYPTGPDRELLGASKTKPLAPEVQDRKLKTAWRSVVKNRRKVHRSRAKSRRKSRKVKKRRTRRSRSTVRRRTKRKRVRVRTRTNVSTASAGTTRGYKSPLNKALVSNK